MLAEGWSEIDCVELEEIPVIQMWRCRCEIM